MQLHTRDPHVVENRLRMRSYAGKNESLVLTHAHTDELE